MKRMTQEEIKKVQLDMLEAFAKFCNQNGLRYFLDAGSLLGAIRHDGFIPWDDDIDLAMPRIDYDRAILLGKNGFGDYYRIMTEEENGYTMAKVIDTRTLLVEFPKTHRNKISVYMDLFPKDGVANLSKKSYRKCKKVAVLGIVYWFNKVAVNTWKKSGNVFKKCLASIYAIFLTEKGKKRPLIKLKKMAKELPFDKAPYCATIVNSGMDNCVPTECLNQYELHKFEHLQVNIPVGYDQYLRKLYSKINDGDYMVLPPEEKRVKHDNEAYWIGETEQS